MIINVIRVSGENETHTIPQRDPFKRIYELLNCNGCDTVNLKDGRVMIVDDTGMIDGKPINPKATAIYHTVRNTPYSIHGDVAIAVDEDFA